MTNIIFFFVPDPKAPMKPFSWNQPWSPVGFPGDELMVDLWHDFCTWGNENRLPMKHGFDWHFPIFSPWNWWHFPELQRTSVMSKSWRACIWISCNCDPPVPWNMGLSTGISWMTGVVFQTLRGSSTDRNRLEFCGKVRCRRCRFGIDWATMRIYRANRSGEIGMVLQGWSSWIGCPLWGS